MTAEAAGPAPNQAPSRAAWQRLLLPLMSLMLVVAALFFAAMSVFELRDFYRRVELKPLDLASTFSTYEAAHPQEAQRSLDYLEFKVKATLEADALFRRYHQANATMLARVWTRQLGFLTGMILAVVGAAFILGRLKGDATRIEAEGKGIKGALATSSPGIVLCSLGTLLMAITLVIPFGVETNDAAVYLGPDITIAAPASPGGTLTREPPPDPGPPPP
ncbi:MAG: hypothetical protein HWE39_14945 [Oceanospirillaceae bacterium]|nr:hypothetical protein [Oceanospirillaceae bacterium]